MKHNTVDNTEGSTLTVQCIPHLARAEVRSILIEA
jgi:hypothetical protein